MNIMGIMVMLKPIMDLIRNLLGKIKKMLIITILQSIIGMVERDI